MEEELVKRNTDCVYFLASPLTCKKGIDCEFRHSKIARLNPKECWYWLAGNCLNPTCAFRHPPLDGHGGTPSESSPPSVTSNKTSVPCYFYSNGFCSKGDKCSFLHDTDSNASNGKSSKTASACNEALALTSENEAAAGNGALARISESKAPAGNEELARTSENKAPAGNEALALNSETKASVGNDTMSAPRITHLNPSETASKAIVGTRFQHKENLSYFEQRVQRDVPQKSVYTQISTSGDEEAGEIRSDSLPEDSSIRTKSHSWTDQSSEDEDDDLVPEERWESSPGFDVLVDGKSDNLGCDDDQEYFPTLHGEHRELNNRFLGYDFENPDEYVPEYPDARLLHDRDMYNDCLDTRIIFGNQGPNPVYTKERMSDSMFSSKRKHMPRELFDGDEDFLDLRDRLRRRRVTDGRSITGLSRRHESLGLFGRPQRHGLGRRLHGRLASVMGNNTYESLRGNGAFSNGGIQRGSLRHAQEFRYKKHHKERRPAKQQFPWSEISKKPFPREKRCAGQPTTFTGPKSLAQIREEKRKAEENGGSIGVPKRARRTVDFQGPKPLKEILKEKGKIPD
ncbi:zinc finger CCCH domain-containing protein 32-like isoform X2 [Malus sylvestris]|uniref:zinc finger CCCH domain-containing protein 32-like isoform X2 n=1 Tax=Malus sylvestris TaxID=3752 RepID=UPI0010AA9988|nr:zinc finger CCCH domain-containing protein 32-like [Malus domestica]XP_050125377.1 zinc finger CCCH domain-containing protein 32-like isoform X2 [Malus sylvestris]